MLTHRRYQQHRFFSSKEAETENLAIAVTDIGGRSPFSVLATNSICELHLCSSVDTFQCFPFCTYAEDGSERRENITDWALEEFQEHYRDKRISKWDIFYYVYAVLHHPHYRERFAANMRRDLLRIPYAPDFRGFAAAGKRLAELHVNFEQQEEYWWHRIENPKVLLSYRVEKMKLSKDKRSIIYNEFLTIDGIPAEVFEYRLRRLPEVTHYRLIEVIQTKNTVCREMIREDRLDIIHAAGVQGGAGGIGASAERSAGF